MYTKHSGFHTLSEVKGTDTLSQEKQRVFTPFPDWLKGMSCLRWYYDLKSPMKSSMTFFSKNWHKTIIC
jgi:hypothetical protein